jgi:hypothetical protein
MDQLIRMSDYSPYFQFVLMNKTKMLVTSIVAMLFLLLLTGRMMKNIIRKRFAIILFAILLLSAVTSQTAFLISLFSTLTQEQIKTVKSINSPEFQTIVQKSILRNGATLDAINSAVKEFQENVAVKKPQENESLWNKMGKDGIELYNNTAVK